MLFCIVLQRLLGSETPANKVLEIKTDTYGTQTVILRDESMILYGPPTNVVTGEKKALYEIILHRPYAESTNNIYGFR